jgi:hypothetical protein
MLESDFSLLPSHRLIKTEEENVVMKDRDSLVGVGRTGDRCKMRREGLLMITLP